MKLVNHQVAGQVFKEVRNQVWLDAGTEVWEKVLNQVFRKIWSQNSGSRIRDNIWSQIDETH